jgi:hypothetical protein
MEEEGEEEREANEEEEEENPEEKEEEGLKRGALIEKVLREEERKVGELWLKTE